MFVHFDWRRKQQSVRWSWGYCNSCRQNGPVRLANYVDVLYLYFVIPVSEQKGQEARCDFCRQPIAWVVDEVGIELADWSPKDGLLALLTKLELLNPFDLPPMSSDERLHSLLSSIEKSSSIARVELRPVGLLAGLVVGALAAVPLALWLHDNKIIPPPHNKREVVILSSLAGMGVGLLLGGLIEFILRRDRSAVTRIKEACEDYHLDLYRLEELSRTYNKSVQQAVKTVCEDVPRDW